MRAITRGCYKACEQFAEDMETAYESQIRHFYEDEVFRYNDPQNRPLYYHRTHSLYYASTGYRWKHRGYKLAWKDSNHVYGGIVVDGNFTRENADYKADNEWVFDRAYDYGIHGLTRGDYAGRNRRMNSETANRLYGNIKASARANDFYEVHIPRTTKPSPETRMNSRWFKSIQKKNLDPFVNKFVEEELKKTL